MLDLQRLHNTLYQQKGLQQQDVVLSQQTFDANESLKNDTVLSA